MLRSRPITTWPTTETGTHEYIELEPVRMNANTIQPKAGREPRGANDAN